MLSVAGFGDFPGSGDGWPAGLEPSARELDEINRDWPLLEADVVGIDREFELWARRARRVRSSRGPRDGRPAGRAAGRGFVR